MTASGHVPVMLREVLDLLAPRAGGLYLDATFGGGGYTAAILDAADCTVFAIDRDPDAIARGAALAARHPGRLHLIEGRFGDMVDLLAARGVSALDGVAFDLGVSSFQLDEAARGFSFRAEGPLDMRMGRSGASAADLVNTLDERALADLIHRFGEERHARRVARAIVRARAEAPIATTSRLAAIVRAAVPRAADGIDPATRSFQALRICVNEELDELARGLAAAIGLLSPGGRIVAVSFHSLEDRIVKHAFAEAAGRAPGASRHHPAALAARPVPRLRLLTPKPLMPGADEAAANPRARSARLRAAERLAAVAA
ncbi:16S rRNA (cytosine(1402)-N(4))-methyltransferase RsmH [Elioraea tepidiphila]|jgi:16S rRNA (cytosine1402-N4)-methyltransferase|uniref:16S rRNA (cytosine(1402)-N(4))-methyltransferase RsmH n=1 Tax=Elioraea tepidiphila TaxID=457934 RepID=UPI00037D0E9A|nr:16S rRNA (cytosine(1402)-N(4))-methyltransferase RsmH [Elioraea tepidiphila]